MSDPDRLRVWAVVFSNFPDPHEVIALYDNEAAAQAHADAEESDGLPYEVIPWDVESEYRL